MNYITGQTVEGLYKEEKISGHIESYGGSQIVLLESGKWLPVDKVQNIAITGKNLREDLRKNIEDKVQMDWKGVSELVKDSKKTPDEVVKFYQDKVKQNVADAKKNEKDADDISRGIVLDNLAKAGNDGTKGNDDLDLEKCVTELQTDTGALTEQAEKIKNSLKEYRERSEKERKAIIEKAMKEDMALDEDYFKDLTDTSDGDIQSSASIEDFLNFNDSIDDDMLDSDFDNQADNIPDDIPTDTPAESTDIEHDPLDDDPKLVDDDFASINLEDEDDTDTPCEDGCQSDEIENEIMGAVDSYDASSGFSDEELFNHVIDTLNLGVEYGRSLFESHDRNASDSLVALSEALSLSASLQGIGDKIAAFFLKLIGYHKGVDKSKMELVGSVKMSTATKIESDDFRDSDKKAQIVNALKTALNGKTDMPTVDKAVDDLFYDIIPNRASKVLVASGRQGVVSKDEVSKFYTFNNCENYISDIKKQVAA